MVSLYRDAAIQTTRPLADGEIQTHEGGIAFAVDKWTRLRRFLILGSEKPFYGTEQELTIANIGVVKECAQEFATRTVEEIVKVSSGGLAPKNDPAILALAIMSVSDKPIARQLAFNNLSYVCRTGTHILHFAAYREALGGGWGKGMKRAVGKWFTDKTPKDLAYQAVKYPSRDGWALSDLLRLAHPKGSRDFDYVSAHILGKDSDAEVDHDTFEFLRAACVVRDFDGVVDVGEFIRKFRLPREALPTYLLNDPQVWDALLADMPMTAMIRNLGKMSKVGLLVNGSDAVRTVCDRLLDIERLKKARVHPIQILSALKVYEQGHGERGKLTWTPVKAVINVLDEAFYRSFGTVTPTNKRIRLALDVSGSMSAPVNGMPFMSAYEAEAAMALVTLAVEPQAHVVAYSHQMVGLPIRPSMRLDEVLRIMRGTSMGGGTYCSLPIQDAIQSGAQIDAFVSMTDSETWNGAYRRSFYGGYANRWSGPSPTTVDEALQEYRMRSGINARNAVVAFSANEFSVANPNDPGQMDMAGLDASLPHILSEFIGGTL